MMDYINLDFCIIENPLDKNKKPIIFVTRKGVQYLDETVTQEEDYEKAIYAIQDIGYVESDTLTFEFSQDPDFPNITTQRIKEVLEKKGMKYSRELEKNMRSEFELYDSNAAKKYIQGLPHDVLSVINKKSTYKIPEIGEKLTLYFYLFVECNFMKDKCFINLTGDFTSKLNNDFRNYLMPFKCEFVRISNLYNPNKIILKSCMVNSEIIKKLPIEFAGTFSIKSKEKNVIIDKSFIYFLMEIKNNFPQENRITIEIDSSYNFDRMIEMSKLIKVDYKTLAHKTYNVPGTIVALEKIKEIITPKMFNYADADEYEKAGIVKKDISYLEDRIEKLKSIKQEYIAHSQFIKHFHIN
jgi:hypothetical protein